MTTFDYNYQNSFRFCFVIEICQSRWGLKNNSPNLHKKTTNWRILVVVVKWRHRAIVLLTKLVYGSSPLFSIPGSGFPLARTRMCGIFTIFLWLVWVLAKVIGNNVMAEFGKPTPLPFEFYIRKFCYKLQVRRWKSIARFATLSHEPKLNEAIASFWGIPSSDDHSPFSCRLTIACIVTCRMSFLIVSSGGKVLFVMAYTGTLGMPYLFQASGI